MKLRKMFDLRLILIICAVMFANIKCEIVSVDSAISEESGTGVGSHSHDHTTHEHHPYWEHWRCTNSRENFLRIFHTAIKKSKYNCLLSPEHNSSLHFLDMHHPHSHDHEEEQESTTSRRQELRSVPGILSRRRRQPAGRSRRHVQGQRTSRGQEQLTKMPNLGKAGPSLKGSERKKRRLREAGSVIPIEPEVYPLLGNSRESGENYAKESDSPTIDALSPSISGSQEVLRQTVQNLGSDMFNSSSAEVHYNNIHLKKLRGCQWENSTHYCVQYIVFAVEEPHCMPLNSVTHIEPSTSEEDKEEDIVNDILKLEFDKPPLHKVWGYGLVACTVVIIVGRLGVILVPLLKKDLYKSFVITTVGLAAGTLTGSSIFHLLPKAFSLEEQFDGKKSLNRCLVIATGLWIFLVIERVLKILLHHKERQLHNSRREKVHNVLASEAHEEENYSVSVVSVGRRFSGGKTRLGIPTIYQNESAESKQAGEKLPKKIKCVRDECKKQCICGNPQIKDKLDFQLHTIRFQESQLSSVSTQAWMIIVGDSFLDFVDGLSIGTAFQDSILTGFSISLGILLDELPHELGEFAVLLTAGLTFYQALWYKIIASCTTYLGLAVGIWLGGVEAGHYVFALAAGMFLYIAMVDMIPELNEAAMESTKISVRKGLKVLFLQNVGLLLGMATIYVMALYEDVFRRF